MTFRRMLAVSIMVVALSVGATAQAQRRYPIPPPPADVYDAREGPFFVSLDTSGRIEPDQLGILDTAWASWRGPKHESFILCHVQAEGSVVSGRAVLRGLHDVSAALRARGAAVVIAAARLCDARAASLRADRSYVRILGVLRT